MYRYTHRICRYTHGIYRYTQGMSTDISSTLHTHFTQLEDIGTHIEYAGTNMEYIGHTHPGDVDRHVIHTPHTHTLHAVGRYRYTHMGLLRLVGISQL